jgi:fibronectin-binding autotransporter adhesin
MVRPDRLVGALACVVLLSASSAPAQFVWNGGGSNDNWSSAANWGGSGPAADGGTGVTVTFAGTTRPNTVMDLGSTGSPFVLNGLTVNNDAGSGFTVTGGPLQFAGTTPTVTFNGGPTVFLRLNSAVSFAASTTFNNTANSTGLLYEMNLTGQLTGAGNLTHAGGTGRDLVIGGRNNNLAGIVTQANGGTLWLGGSNALGRLAALNITGGTVANGTDAAEPATGVPAGGFGQQHRSLAGTSGAFQVGASTNAATTVVGFDNTSATLASQILGPSTNSHLGKVGTGTLTYTGTGPYAGNLSVRDGTFDVRGTAGGTNGGFSNATSTGRYAVYAGATLSETITGGTGSAGRIGNATTIGLGGGTFTFDVGAIGTNAGGFSEVVGALAVDAGQSGLRINTSAVTGARVSFASLTLSGGIALAGTGTLFVQSGNLGTTGFATAGAGNVAVNGGTGPAATLFVGPTTGYSTGATDMRVLPFTFAATSFTGAPSTFVTYDATNQSLRGLESTNYVSAFGAATDNVSLVR